MTDYVKITDFSVKDTLPTSDPAKIITGTAHDNEYNAIVTAIASKSNMIHAGALKTTIDDADEVSIADSGAAFVNKRITFANLKVVVNAYFDTLYQTLVNKDATGGYAGLTLFKINFKNAANTFTSFFTNSNTAARTYTFQDKDGTIADLVDVAGAGMKIAVGQCTQATGALTFTLPTMAVDFRSTTLTSGTITTVTGTPSDLVLPSGATLGSVTTVSARIVRVLINNAGTLEQAIVNISGGNDLSETGVINTTAIDTASDSANVFYSTTARTGVAYKVVGIVEAVNTAGAWGDPTLVQGVGGQVIPAVPQMRLFKTVASTSGTSIDFTGIQSSAKKITVSFASVSTSGGDHIIIQLGDSGGVETTGYLAVSSALDGATTTSTFSTGIGVYGTNDLAVRHGNITFTLVDPGTNAWAASGAVARSDGAQMCVLAGSKALSATLDRVRITTTGGANTFDGGLINILVEG